METLVIGGSILLYIIMGYVVAGLFLRWVPDVIGDGPPISFLIVGWPIVVICILLASIFYVIIPLIDISARLAFRICRYIYEPVYWISGNRPIK